MNKYNVNVLAEAKEEYQRQLVNILSPEIYIGIKSIYDVAYTYCKETNDKNVLKKFQKLLSNIPKWNTDKIYGEYDRITTNSNCDFIEDLITAVFVSHTKILSSIKIKKNSKPIPLNVPVGTHFIHKCYIESARNFWKKSWLLDRDVSAIEIQRNQNDSELLIKESIIETVRKLLPVKYILKEYLGNDYQDDNDDEITENLSSSTRENLRSLVKQEIENQSLQKNKELDDNFSHLEILDNSNDSEDENIKSDNVQLDSDNKTQTGGNSKLSTESDHLENSDQIKQADESNIQIKQENENNNLSTESEQVVEATSVPDEQVVEAKSVPDEQNMNTNNESKLNEDSSSNIKKVIIEEQKSNVIVNEQQEQSVLENENLSDKIEVKQIGGDNTIPIISKKAEDEVPIDSNKIESEQITKNIENKESIKLEISNSSNNDTNTKIIKLNSTEPIKNISNTSKDSHSIDDKEKKSELDFSIEIDSLTPSDKIIKEVDSIEKNILNSRSDNISNYSEELSNNEDIKDIHNNIIDTKQSENEFSFFEDAAL